jgi:hypothetical protein
LCIRIKLSVLTVSQTLSVYGRVGSPETDDIGHVRTEILGITSITFAEKHDARSQTELCIGFVFSKVLRQFPSPPRLFLSLQLILIE